MFLSIDSQYEKVFEDYPLSKEGWYVQNAIEGPSKFFIKEMPDDFLAILLLMGHINNMQLRMITENRCVEIVVMDYTDVFVHNSLNSNFPYDLQKLPHAHFDS